MTGNVIKEFLVGLGFKINESQLQKFNKSIASATLRVGALYSSIKLAGAGVFYGITKISEGFEQLGYSLRILSPSINRAIYLQQVLLKTYARVGIDVKKAANQAVIFNLSLAKTKILIESLYRSVGLKFLPILTRQMDIFRKQIYENLPKIKRQLESFVYLLLKAFQATTIIGKTAWQLLERLFDILKKLHDETGGWSTAILGIITLWNLLNLSFLSTPLGKLFALSLILLALYDDYKHFQKFGRKNSFFDWSDAIPVINAVTKALEPLAALLKSIVTSLSHIQKIGIKGSFLEFLNGLKGFVQTRAQQGEDFVRYLGEKLIPSQPIGVPTTNQTHNLFSPSMNQENTIIVQGAADASAVGKSVVDQLNKSNFNMIYDAILNLRPKAI